MNIFLCLVFQYLIGIGVRSALRLHLGKSVTGTGTRGTNAVSGLTHKFASSHASYVNRLDLMGSVSRVLEIKLNILPLNQILVLRIGYTDSSVMNKNISELIAILQCNKPISSLVIKPLHLTNKSRSRNINGRTHNRLYCIWYIVIFCLYGLRKCSSK